MSSSQPFIVTSPKLTLKPSKIERAQLNSAIAIVPRFITSPPNEPREDNQSETGTEHNYYILGKPAKKLLHESTEAS